MSFLKYIVSILVIFCFFSCSNEKQEKIITLEMGTVEFEEPFVGIFKSRPSLLLWSLNHIPCSWFAPDTSVIEHEFVMSFNEDCIRSKSEVYISITDTLKKPAQGLRVKFENSEENPIFKVVANKDSQTVKVRYKVKPELGDTMYKGFITVDSNELDYINESSLQDGDNIAAKWSIEQVIGKPVILWVLWILIPIVIIAIIIKIIIGIINLLIPILSPLFSNVVSSAATASSNVASSAPSFVEPDFNCEFGNNDYNSQDEVNTEVDSDIDDSINEEIGNTDLLDYKENFDKINDIKDIWGKIEDWNKKSGHCVEFICGYYDGKMHYRNFIHQVNLSMQNQSNQEDVRDKTPYVAYILGVLKSQKEIDIENIVKIIPLPKTKINISWNDAYKMGVNASIEHNSVINKLKNGQAKFSDSVKKVNNLSMILKGGNIEEKGEKK